jgi:hypothetical protein
LNRSVLLCLRDRRHIDFQDSLLRMVKSSLYEGPIYFNCHPNYSLSLYDPTLLHALELNCLTLVYRVYYKLMKTTLEPQALVESPKGQTLLLQTSTRNSSIQIPK